MSGGRDSALEGRERCSPRDRMRSWAMITTQRPDQALRQRPAVDGVDLDVREGDRYGFLGPNGSGKTTLIRMLLGLVLRDQRRDRVLGQPMPRRGAAVLPQVGALVEGPAAYPHLSGRANLALLDAAGTARRRGAPGGAGSTRRWTGSVWPASTAAGAPTRSACASGWAWPPRCCARPGCSSSTSRPTASTRSGIREIRELLRRAERGRHDGLPVQPPARRGRAAVHPGRRRGPRAAGRCRTSWRRCDAPTGRVVVRTPDPDALGRRRWTARSSAATPAS